MAKNIFPKATDDCIPNPAKVLAVPIIATINNKNFEFMHDPNSEPQIGGFDQYYMTFKWHDIPENKKRKIYSDPVASPTMPGGLYTISKSWFFELGSYDPGMEIWKG